MRREIPDGDPAVIVARALKLLRQAVENISLRCRDHNVYESERIFGPYDPSCVREAPAVYGRSMGSLLVPGPVAPRYECLMDTVEIAALLG